MTEKLRQALRRFAMFRWYHSRPGGGPERAWLALAHRLGALGMDWCPDCGAEGDCLDTCPRYCAECVELYRRRRTALFQRLGRSLCSQHLLEALEAESA